MRIALAILGGYLAAVGLFVGDLSWFLDCRMLALLVTGGVVGGVYWWVERFVLLVKPRKRNPGVWVEMEEAA